jgi:hypothetical protein
MAITETDMKNVWSNVWWKDGTSDYLAGRHTVRHPAWISSGGAPWLGFPAKSSAGRPAD